MLWGLIDFYGTQYASRKIREKIAAEERWALREREVQALERIAGNLGTTQDAPITRDTPIVRRD